jgi:transcriptional regulator with XRE-family HTH domain
VNELLDRLQNDFQNEDVRYAYADSVVNALISAQIKTLREDRELNQERLARMIGTKQSGISRLERSDYSAWKVDTLRKLARAFGVRLRISFEEFGTLLDDVAGFKKSKLLPRRFEDDPIFNSAAAAHRTPRVRSSGKRRHHSRLKLRLRLSDAPKKSAMPEASHTAPLGNAAAGGGSTLESPSLGNSSLGKNNWNSLRDPLACGKATGRLGVGV